MRFFKINIGEEIKYIKNGEKEYVIGLKNGIFKNVHVGSSIVFVNNKNRYEVEVEKIKDYTSFRNALKFNDNWKKTYPYLNSLDESLTELKKLYGDLTHYKEIILMKICKPGYSS